MEVFKLRLVMGKTPNYDANGKLKNEVITSKYTGEMELRNILDDGNWRKLGACEISCVSVYDSKTPTKIDSVKMDAINKEIKDFVTGGNKPKTETQLLKEQNELLMARLDAIENGSFDKSKMGGVPDLKNDHRIELETKANKLEVKFRADISDAKLLEKIIEVEPNYKLN